MKLYIEARDYVEVKSMGNADIKTCQIAALRIANRAEGISKIWIIDETIDKHPFDYVKTICYYNKDLTAYVCEDLQADQTFSNIFFNWDVFMALKPLNGRYNTAGDLWKAWMEVEK